jgi:PEP-CTERM motif
MKRWKILLAAVAFMLLSGPLSAHANIIYDWTGDCQRILFPRDIPLCTHATMHIVTTYAYIPGEVFFPHFPVPSPVLLEALYSDGNVTFDMAFIWSFDGSGLLLPATLPGEGEMLTTAHFFRSDANGAWRYEGEELIPNCDRLTNDFCSYGVDGINGVWTRVPEASSLLLLGVGFVGLTFYRRRM